MAIKRPPVSENRAHANSGPSSPRGAREAARARAECQHLDRVAAIAYRPLRSHLCTGLAPPRAEELLLGMMRARIATHGQYSGDNNQLTPGGLLRRVPEWEALHRPDLLGYVNALAVPPTPAQRMRLSDAEVAPPG